MTTHGGSFLENMLGLHDVKKAGEPFLPRRHVLRVEGNVQASDDAVNEETVLTFSADGGAPASHAATHLPGGIDALTTAAPVSVSTANAAGSAASFSRSDHVHALSDDVVTNAKLSNMATATFKGRTTAGTGDPEDLTATQATALLNTAVGDSGSGGTKGMVPAPAAGDAAAGKVLKADMTWVVPGGGAVSDGDKGDVVVSSSGTVWNVDTAAISLAKMANLAQDQFIGRTTASTGVPQTATITAAARTVLDDTTVSAMVNTLGGATATGSGALVRKTSAALTTPDIGVATGESLHLTDQLTVDTQINGLLVGGGAASSLSVGAGSSVTVAAAATVSIPSNATVSGTNTGDQVLAKFPAHTFAIASGAASLDVSTNLQHDCSHGLLQNSTITLTNGTDGCRGSIGIMQALAGGPYTLAFSVSGRTIYREDGATDSNPASANSSITLYEYEFRTIQTQPVVVIRRSKLT